MLPLSECVLEKNTKKWQLRYPLEYNWLLFTFQFCHTATMQWNYNRAFVMYWYGLLLLINYSCCIILILMCTLID